VTWARSDHHDAVKLQSHSPHLCVTTFSACLTSSSYRYVGLQGGHGAALEVHHGMAEEHYISALWVRDAETRDLVFYQEYGPDQAPRARFLIPRGVKYLRAFEHCNQHGVWAGRRVQVPHMREHPLDEF